jgi:uncharacterized membrane protein
MRVKNLDIIIAILVAVINVGWTQVPNRPLIPGIILALPLTLIFPGYTLTQILFRKRSLDHSTEDASSLILQPSLKIGQPLGSTDQIVLSLGLSLAIDILVGFALNIFPPGLQAFSWTLSLGLLTTLFALLAAVRRRGDSAKVAKTTRSRITVYDGILFGLALLVAAAAVWLAIIRPLEPQQSFTQLWMLPTKNNSCAVSIGIQSFETAPVEYRVVMTVNGTQANVWSSIPLSPQQQWSQSMSLAPGHSSSLYIDVRLYLVSQPNTVYREVHLTYHISTGTTDGQSEQLCKTGA